MRIAMAGAGGTGKGTLARSLCNKLNDNMRPHVFLPSPNEVITKWIEPASANFKDMKPENYILKQYAILTANMWQQKYSQDFIAERSLIDYAGYMDESLVDALPDSLKDRPARYQKLIWNTLIEYPYDIVFECIPDFEPDDIAENQWKERNTSDRIATSVKIRNYIEKLVAAGCSTKFVRIEGTREERLAKAMAAINSLARTVGMSTTPT